MKTSRFKIEFLDKDGSRFTISIEGNVSRSKITRILDMMEFMGHLSGEPEVEEEVGMTKFERVKKIVESRFQDSWFSSRDVKFAYEDEYGESIPLSTISTYLQRMHRNGFLQRSGSQNQHIYRLSGVIKKF
ncbi:MAG: hypothetical protein RMJ00_00795 [Nitrososphaerota archaeon]|nr:hypothetical protein [Candidatus Bathyarchaeota archaeon]MCX8161898.1 hypothetical protein [Candidatus Bathyarchaeota archaeon]MDW8061226.1 hypothetical protein [Nitrososphaerota archaeon]